MSTQPTGADWPGEHLYDGSFVDGRWVDEVCICGNPWPCPDSAAIAEGEPDA